MKIAVITPYYKESIDFLRKCHESVLNQRVQADHFFIADGHPNQEIVTCDIKHVTLPSAHADNGNTPRAIGSILAQSEGYDFIAYLDADNWFHPDHLQSLLELWKSTGACVCSSFRTFHTLEGHQIPIEEQEEIELNHVDTSCYLIHKDAFELINIWHNMPKQLSPICDRIFFHGILNKRFSFISTKLKTVAFRSQYKSHYDLTETPLPTTYKDQITKEPYEWLMSIEGIKETVRKLGYVPVFS